MRESCRDGNEDSTPANPNPTFDIETKVWRQNDRVRLFVSADDIVRVVEEVASNLRGSETAPSTVSAQVDILNELAGALLAAIATANSE